MGAPTRTLGRPLGRTRDALSRLFGRVADGLGPALLDRSPEIEPDYYRARHPDLGHIRSDHALRRHYRQFGRSEGRLARRADELRSLAPVHGIAPNDFDAMAYLALNPDVHEAVREPWLGTRHYLTNGRNEGRRYYAVTFGDPRAADLAELTRVVGLHPECAVALFELATHYRRADRSDLAIRLLQRALRVAPDNVRALTLLIILLSRRGEHETAAELATTLGRLPGAPPEIALAVQEFGGLDAQFDPEWAVRRCRELQGGPRFAATHEVAERVRSALDTRSGFSLVRLGDGEGAFLRLSEQDESLYSNLYAYNRENRAKVWFEGQLDLALSGFLRTASSLESVIRAADIVGLPGPDRMEAEYWDSSITGISTQINVLRAVSAWGTPSQMQCDQTVNLQLFDTGLLGGLLQSQTEIGLICCHAQLPDRLREVFGLAAVEFHKLPGEQSMRAEIGAEAAAGVHYPDVFQATMDALSRPLGGKLFLVAGGLLGKFYCERIKASGGVGLDIGSLVDRWAGASTRPGYERATPL